MWKKSICIKLKVTFTIVTEWVKKKGGRESKKIVLWTFQIIFQIVSPSTGMMNGYSHNLVSHRISNECCLLMSYRVDDGIIIINLMISGEFCGETVWILLWMAEMNTISSSGNKLEGEYECHFGKFFLFRKLLCFSIIFAHF